MIPQFNLKQITANAEALGANIEFNLNIPTRQFALIVRKVIDTYTPASPGVLEGIVRTSSDTYILYPKVTEVPNKYVNLVFSDSTSALTVNKGDMLISVPAFVTKDELINVVPGNSKTRYSTSFFLADMSDIDLTEAEEDGVEKVYVFNNRNKLVKYTKVEATPNTQTLPNSAKPYKLVGALMNKNSLIELVVRETIK